MNRLRTWNPRPLRDARRQPAGRLGRRDDHERRIVIRHHVPGRTGRPVARRRRSARQAQAAAGGHRDWSFAVGGPALHTELHPAAVTCIRRVRPARIAGQPHSRRSRGPRLESPLRVRRRVPRGRVRRPDEGLFRTWQVAGTSHNDRKSFASRVLPQHRDIGAAVEDSLDCTLMPVGSAVPFRYVMAAGLDQLTRWVADGTPLPSAPPLVFASGPPGSLARDEFGIALGGIRLAQVEVPIALSTGTNSGPTRRTRGPPCCTSSPTCARRRPTRCAGCWDRSDHPRSVRPLTLPGGRESGQHQLQPVSEAAIRVAVGDHLHGRGGQLW